MQIIENNKIKEKVYIEKLENGLTIMAFPKKTKKKYIIWSTNFGSIDNKFYINGSNELTKVPDGIAHYLEHKLFEQENGRNSLDVLTTIGVDANAFTTNDHTAYLFECTENFDEALVEFMDYVQNPYFTDENVEKERGIIEQEIMMYDDYPEWVVYMNLMKAMYKNNEINIDVAGTKETIAEIDKDKLYTIYNTFYRPENMVLVVCGDFIPEEIIPKLKSMVTMKSEKFDVKRIYNEEPTEIVKDYIEKKMDISMPIVMIGYKDTNYNDNKVKRDLGIGIISNLLFSKSTKLFETLYESGKIIEEPSIDYEFSKTFEHVLIQVKTDYVEEVLSEINNEINKLKNSDINQEDFDRVKKLIYGCLVKDYSDVSTISTNLVEEYFMGINPFEYFEEFNSITKEYVEELLKEVFVENKKVISVIKPM